MDQVAQESSSGHKQSPTLRGVRKLFTRKRSSSSSTGSAGLTERVNRQINQARDFANTTPGSRLVLMAIVSVVIGVLIAGVSLPVVGGFGLVAKAGATTFADLPSELKTPVLGEKTTVLAADGSVLATFYNPRSNRTEVPLDQISPLMQQALIAIEDSRFYDHGGIDLKGTLRALVSTSSGDEVQGGSTLTQQYIKNALMENALQRGDEAGYRDAQIRKGKEGYARKLRELRFAAELEKQETKGQILDNYLNIAYFGNGSYGIETAAQRYFSKSAKDLDLREAAMLAGFVQNPSAYDPFKNPKNPEESQKAALDRRNVVLARMAELGVISPEVAKETQAMDLGLKRSNEQSGCESVEFGAFCDWIRREMTDNPANTMFGATRDERVDNLFDGGLTIKTTLDPRMQRAGQNALSVHVFPEDQVVGTLVTVEPGTGNIRAMANSRKFGSGPNEEKINYAGDIITGGSRGFQAGSTFKIFASAVALEQGFGLNHVINSPYTLSIPDVKRCPGFGPIENYHPLAGYNPRNADPKENGSYDMRKAFGMSINTYYLQLQGQIEGNICPIAKLADAMSVKKASDLQPLDQFSPFSIGFNSVSPTAMAAAYAGFAARGKFCEATAITEVLDRHHQPTEIPDSNCRQVVSPGVADAINEMAKETLNGTGAKSKLSDGRPQAGKTGTHERKALWYIGYTPNLVTAVGSYKPHAKTHTDQEIRYEKIGGKTPGDLGGSIWYGGTLGIPIWKEAMEEMLKGVPAIDFHPMDPIYNAGTKNHDPAGAPEPSPAPADPAPANPAPSGATPTGQRGTDAKPTGQPSSSSTRPRQRPTQSPSTRPSTGRPPTTQPSDTTTPTRHRGRPTATD